MYNHQTPIPMIKGQLLLEDVYPLDYEIIDDPSGLGRVGTILSTIKAVDYPNNIVVVQAHTKGFPTLVLKLKTIPAIFNRIDTLQLNTYKKQVVMRLTNGPGLIPTDDTKKIISQWVKNKSVSGDFFSWNAVLCSFEKGLVSVTSDSSFLCGTALVFRPTTRFNIWLPDTRLIARTDVVDQYTTMKKIGN